MCGINGFVVINNNLKQKDIQLKINLMNDKIIHRGPDDDGVFVNKNIGIGMRRLSIIDVDGGKQPILNENKTLAIVLNGEIYNYKELKDEMKLKGHQFTTESDTEVVLHLFEEYGDGFINYIDGMFSFCIFNINKNELYIYRDRAGEKPLYYYIDENYFLFASELKSILALGIVEKKINKTALETYLQLTYIPAPLTIFENIYKLEAGNCMKYSEAHLKIEKYWDAEYNFDNLIMDYNECKRKLRRTLFESVENRMVADVPIGGFLSGGIDSTVIVGIMSKLSESRINTFTIGFKEKEYDESNRANIVAKFHKTNHHLMYLDFDRALDILDKVISNIDEPFADSSQIPTYIVSEFAKKEVKVILTGDGGDELFAGYDKYLINYYSELYKRIPSPIRHNLIERCVFAMPDKSAITRKINKVIYNSEKSQYERRLNTMRLGFKEEELDKLLKQHSCKKDLSNIETYYKKYEDVTDEISRTLYLDLKVVLEGDMLAKVDRNSMLASLETRVPMLSKNMIELAARIPSQYKIRGKQRKLIFKEAFKDLIPKELMQAAKHGFGVPIGLWLRKELKSDFLSLVNKDFIEEQGIFNYEYLMSVFNEHMQGIRNRASELWTIYIFQKWYKNFVVDNRMVARL